jgi:hypothetical protein
MKFRETWPEYVICPYSDPKKIEWTSSVRSGAIPYGLMVRTYPRGEVPQNGFAYPGGAMAPPAQLEAEAQPQEEGRHRQPKKRPQQEDGEEGRDDQENRGPRQKKAKPAKKGAEAGMVGRGAKLLGGKSMALEEGAFVAIAVEERGALKRQVVPQIMVYDDALQYLEQVQTQFGDQPKVYHQFLGIMKKFKAQAIDMKEVTDQVTRRSSRATTLLLWASMHSSRGRGSSIRGRGVATTRAMERASPSRSSARSTTRTMTASPSLLAQYGRTSRRIRTQRMNGG